MKLLKKVHKLWPFKKLLCFMERHDFEVEEIENDWAILYCLDCGKKKKSFCYTKLI